MSAAEQHLDNVCEGRFPYKARVIFITGKFKRYPSSFRGRGDRKNGIVRQYFRDRKVII